MPQRPASSAWIRVVTSIADQAVVGTVEATHRAITDANFRWTGSSSRGVKALHDTVVEHAYGGVRSALRGSGAVAASIAERVGTAGDESPAGARARAIAIGSVDAALIDTVPDFDPPLSLVLDGRVVSTTPDDLRAAHPEASDRLVVFVHGLVATEVIWEPTPLPDVVANAGATPLRVRYGSGRSVVRNGADLADLLDATVAGWPVPVTRLVVVAHSMGGLVTRAAISAGREGGHAWPAVLTDVVHLATPHLGSWLEKVANVTSWSLRRASTRTAPLGELLDRRSRGIKDLRFGALVDAWWGDGSVDDLHGGFGGHVAWPRDVAQHLVVGRVRPGAGHPLNVAVGDGLVRSGSATGAGRWDRIPPGGEVRVTSVAASHNQLAHHSGVARLLASILEPS